MSLDAVDALSIGSRIKNRDRDVEFDRQSGIRRLKKIDLIEINVVTFPANDLAHFQRSIRTSIEASEFPDKRSLEALLGEAQFSGLQPMHLLLGGYDTLRPEAELEEAEIVAVLERLRAVVRG